MTEITSESLGGIGQWVTRKEDPRFVHGKGKFVEDIYLPGMVYGVFVRSPYAHAKINGINTEAALKVPGVITVVTAEVLKGLKLDWMPTLAGDTQAVLAGDKVRFQSQEVAFVVVDTQYAATDGHADQYADGDAGTGKHYYLQGDEAGRHGHGLRL